jgi:uncharacterized protein
LTVSGLFWLREGANDFGAAPSNDIVLPHGSAAERIGAFELSGGKVTLRVADGVSVTANDKPVREHEVKSDGPGKPDLIKAGDLSFILLKRSDRYGIRLKDKNSHARREFTGLRWYPVKESYRITAQFVAYDQPMRLNRRNSLSPFASSMTASYPSLTSKLPISCCRR